MGAASGGAVLGRGVAGVGCAEAGAALEEALQGVFLAPCAKERTDWPQEAQKSQRAGSDVSKHLGHWLIGPSCMLARDKDGSESADAGDRVGRK